MSTGMQRFWKYRGGVAAAEILMRKGKHVECVLDKTCIINVTLF